MPAVLIIDDNKAFARSLGENLEDEGFTSFSAFNSEQALGILRTEEVHLILLDIVLARDDGVLLLQTLRKQYPRIPVVMLTAYASVQTAVDTLKSGAFDYLQKPVDIDRLVELIRRAVTPENGGGDKAPAPARGDVVELTEIITSDPEMERVIERARKIAASELPVLILGENGTGKEVMADFIHAASERSSCSFFKVNCAALPESLLDNELFGHEKGAYTGANSLQKGVFESAHGGTILLDEIGDMAVSTQAKILRVLQNKEIRRIGGMKTIRVDIRIIAATNQDLSKLTGEGKFREDVLYRLNAATLRIPPLRERTVDIFLLCSHFLNALARESGAPVKGLSPEVRSQFEQHSWPGNVRELKNVLSFAHAMCSGELITADDLPSPFSDTEIGEGETGLLERNESKLIMEVLRKTGFNKSAAANLLKISRNTLYNKMRRYGISE